MRIRRAKPGDGPAVARLIRASLPAAFLPFTIWRSAQAGAWVETQLAEPPSGDSSVYYLLISPTNDCAGVLEFRPRGADVFLNHIGVAPYCRGLGAGRFLLQQASEDFLALRSGGRILLDVDPSNAIAYPWYRRMGFAPCGETFWQLGEIRPSSARAGAVVETAQAAAMHRRFGFSQLAIETAEGMHMVGRLGGDYFRLDAAAWSDPSVHGALRLLDPKRHILLVAPAVQPGLPFVRHTHRLAMEAALLVAGLEAVSRDFVRHEAMRRCVYESGVNRSLESGRGSACS